MATTLAQIRFIIERSVGKSLDNEWVINMCNDAQAEFSLDINIPDTTQIPLTTTDLEYALPVGLKIINRLRLQSDFDAHIDKEFRWKYRIYNGKLIFQQPWMKTDTLNVDFYKHMKLFTDLTNTIDMDDRFASLYTSYGQREFYDLPEVKAEIGEAAAQKNWEKHNVRYMGIRRQVVSYYAIQNEPVSIDERW